MVIVGERAMVDDCKAVWWLFTIVTTKIDYYLVEWWWWMAMAHRNDGDGDDHDGVKIYTHKKKKKKSAL